MSLRFYSRGHLIQTMKRIYEKTVPKGYKLSLESQNPQSELRWEIHKIHESHEDYREEKVLEISIDLRNVSFNNGLEDLPEWVKSMVAEIDSFFGGDEVIRVETN